MTKGDLQSRILGLMARKTTLPEIIEHLSDTPERHVTATYDALKMQAFDIDLAFGAAA